MAQGDEGGRGGFLKKFEQRRAWGYGIQVAQHLAKRAAGVASLNQDCRRPGYTRAQRDIGLAQSTLIVSERMTNVMRRQSCIRLLTDASDSVIECRKKKKKNRN